MATLPQIEANRLNAQHSTGPRTPQGKAVSSQNAFKSGLDGALACAGPPGPALRPFSIALNTGIASPPNRLRSGIRGAGALACAGPPGPAHRPFSIALYAGIASP